MKANTRSFAAGAALASVGVLIVRRLAPNAHGACRAGCSQLCAHGCGDGSHKATAEVQHA